MESLSPDMTYDLSSMSTVELRDLVELYNLRMKKLKLYLKVELLIEPKSYKAYQDFYNNYVTITQLESRLKQIDEVLQVIYFDTPYPSSFLDMLGVITG